ncbi:MAG: mechanosensitive ion channel [Proteobacteria bacterium]|nr:mechanosensitive ion channel [Pseudomonadota bacterium]
MFIHRIITLIISIILFVAPVYALPAETDAIAEKNTPNKSLQFIQERNQADSLQLQKLAKLSDQETARLKAERITLDDISRVRFNLDLARTEFLSADQAWRVSKHQMLQIKNQLQQAKADYQEAKLSALDSKQLRNTAAVTQLEKKYNELLSLKKNISKLTQELERSKTLRKELLNVRQNQYQQIQNLYNQYQKRLQSEETQRLANSEEQKRHLWIQELTSYQDELSKLQVSGYKLLPARAFFLSEKIFETQEKINYLDFKLILNTVHYHVETLSQLDVKSLSIPELDKLIARTIGLLQELTEIKQQLQDKLNLLAQQNQIQQQAAQKKLLSDNDYQKNKNAIETMIHDYESLSKEIPAFEVALKQNQSDLKKVSNYTLAKRQGLPGFDAYSWLTLGKNIINIPKELFQQVRLLKNHIVLAANSLESWQWGVLGFCEVIWLIVWILVRRYADQLIEIIRVNTRFVSSSVLFFILEIVRRNLGSFMILTMLTTLFLFLNIPFIGYSFLFYLLIVWMVFHSVIQVAKFSLLESMNNISGQDVKLYYRLRQVFIVGGVITALTVLAHQLPLAFDVRNLFNRLFMIFLGAVSLVLLKGHRVVPSLLEPYIDKKRPYLHRAVSLLFILIPITLLFNAVIGLFGYVALAWDISYYQVIFLVVLTGYVIARGIVVDILEFISQLCIHYLQNGWLWSQAFLKPLDRILRISVFLFSVLVLFLMYGWGSDSLVWSRISQILHYSLFTYTNAQITTLSLIEFSALLILVLWLAKWTREFSYRWLYHRVRDHGLRNSFAVFTQYAAVLLSALLTLHVLGIDFTGMTVILSALALGLGFGLRDFANNIVSGILLLIERPVRVGDIVSIGAHEGEVTHIGLRSMMVQSWDHMEIMVPNSETFNKTFTNWTHQDSIIRTVVSIKIHRLDDPAEVQKIITEVLAKFPKVLKIPVPEIFLCVVSEVLIEFEVRYYHDVSLYSRFELRSEVLFLIWAAFKKAGIRPPYPQQDIHIV